MKVFKRVLAAAARCERFFDLSNDERVQWMVERAHRMGWFDSRRRAARRRAAAAPYRSSRGPARDA